MSLWSRRSVATRAKQVTVASVAVAAVGAMYGVSNDGRDATPADEPPPSPTTNAVPAAPTSTLGGATSTLTPALATTTMSTLAPVTSRLRTRAS